MRVKVQKIQSNNTRRVSGISRTLSNIFEHQQSSEYTVPVQRILLILVHTGVITLSSPGELLT